MSASSRRAGTATSAPGGCTPTAPSGRASGSERVDNACVCNVHHHHAYWRLDFDIAGAADDSVLEFNDPPLAGQDRNWHTLRHEIRRKRNPGRTRRWRVRNRGSGEGYVITPGRRGR